MVHGPGWDASVAWFGVAFYCPVSSPLSLLCDADCYHFMESSSTTTPKTTPKTPTQLYEERKKVKLEEKIAQFKIQERRQIELRVDQAIRDSGEVFDDQMRNLLIMDQENNLFGKIMHQAAASGKTLLEELHGE